MLEPHTAEALADILFEVGKDLLKRAENYRASKWLEKSHELLRLQPSESFSPDANELLLSITHLLGKPQNESQSS